MSQHYAGGPMKDTVKFNLTVLFFATGMVLMIIIFVAAAAGLIHS